MFLFCGTWWLVGRVDSCRGRVDRVVGSNPALATLGKSFTRSCLWRFGVKLRHSIRTVSGAPLSSSLLEEAL